MEVVIGVVIGAILAVIGFTLGRSQGRAAGAEAAERDIEQQMRGLVESLRRGTLPSDAQRGTPEGDLRSALSEGWAPRAQERDAALREAVGRVSGFLGNRVRAPLAGAGEHAGAEELRKRIGEALGALEDLDYFGRDVAHSTEGVDLVVLAQRVCKEFVTDQGVGVRVLLGEPSIRASVNAPALMDALYLVLHNAGRFGERQTVDLSVAREDGRALITVRDHGEGFTEEAFSRAFDPFYSTTDDGLGLGLPHARKVIEGMGGEIQLRNVPDGGAEVEISFSA